MCTYMISPVQSHIVTNYVFGTTRNLILGAGLCYAVKKEEYSHVPLIVFFPSIYAGFHLFKHKDEVIRRLHPRGCSAQRLAEETGGT
jgi:hypothetical protein